MTTLTLSLDAVDMTDVFSVPSYGAVIEGSEERSSSIAILHLEGGNTYEITGSPLTYSPDPNPDGSYPITNDSILTGIYARDSLHQILFGVDDFSVDVATLGTFPLYYFDPQLFAGADLINGSVGGDNLLGYNGNDTLNGNGGNDRLTGGAGNDTFDGGTGGDVLSGGAGNDFLDGGAGADKLVGAGGNDTLVWGSTDKSVNGGTGSDTLKLASGNLNLVGITTIVDVENIDLRGAGNNKLTLNKADVLDISSTTHTLKVLGDVGDTLHISGAFTDASDNLAGFHRFTFGAGVVLQIDDHIALV